VFDLKGKVAIITGSSRGIGRSIAERMAAAGARVVVSSRKAEACADVVAAIEGSGAEACAIACNVSRQEQLEGLVTQTLERWGRIDILVCNAAVNPYFGPMSGISAEAYAKIMDSNVGSTFRLCNLAAPHIARAGGGSIIIITSIGGNQGSATLGVYGMSKAAETALVRNLAVEWGPQGIRANCIAPGLIRTDFSRALWENPQLLSAVEKGTPLRRIGEPDDIGGVAVFLASPAAAYLTGQTLTVDGGITVKEPA
jgi:NAD(P)-dependent dehydrogenase (short-subunit alcohol dehydrogenase family)